MKRIVTLVGLLLVTGMAAAQVTTENYIRTRQMLNEGGSSYVDEIAYYDGLGRPFQQVVKAVQGGSAVNKNRASFQEYDLSGRMVNSWLPVSSGSSVYLSPASFKSSAPSGRNNDSRPYVQSVYESSLLNRLSRKYGAGAAWYTGNHSDRKEYLSNVQTSGNVQACRYYSVSSTGTLSGGSGYYPSGTLSVWKETDEDDRVRYTFTDRLGRILLIRRMSGSTQHDTYYVYDVQDNLRFVLQPQYQTSADLGKYAFQYKYDGYGRCTERKLPGADAVKYEYDEADRIIFSQDGVQRASNKWTYYLYDDLDRLTEQGECTGKNVSSGKTVWVKNYYDNYDFRSRSGFNNGNFPAGTVSAKGYLTGCERTVFGCTSKQYVAFYYDIKGRVTKQVCSNLLGGYDVTTTGYTFTGNPSTVTHTHTASGKTGRTEVYTYTYDHEDRPVTVRHKLGSTQVTLATYVYDNLGRLQSRSFHGSTSNKVTYAYNIRDWLTGISGSKFTQNLYYNTGSGIPQYGGNISSMAWKVGNESTTRGYKFSYDNLSRLTSATYGEGTDISSNANRFTEKVTGYDLNGNIKGLQRYGQTSSTGYGLIDNLTYTLSGNHVTRVDDAATASVYNNGFEFKDAVQQADEYAYDKNGNLTKDLNRNITSIQYNCLNLPSKVTFGNGNTITYLYAADGTKLRTVHKAGSTTTTTDYCGNVVYENGTQKLLLTEEGYVTLADNKYHYYLKDHQGNNRVVISQSGTVEETNHYYPFGGVFAATNNVQPYKYNGKEFDGKNGLNWYDYGARHYDATLGRFVSVDPLAEQDYAVSPYTYCGNNPIMYIDPDGRFANPIYDQEGNFLGTDNRGLQGDAIIMDSKFFQQGMEHELAEGLDLGLSSLDEGTRGIVEASVRSLADRPDYDGFVTVSEGIRWAKDHPNALNYPTPNNALYINAALLDFGELSVDKIGIPNIGKPVRTQLFTVPNTLESIYNERLRATVYALGRVNVTLQNPVLRTISVVNDEATYYDWNQGDSFVRRSAIFLERMRTGLNDTHGFRAYYYGYGVLRK